MELTQLRYFREIARCGHMTKAAQKLGLTQPALSAVMKKLEAEVGAELLHRIGRGVELTEAGRVLLLHAEEAIRRTEAGVEAVRALMGLEAGSIRIGGGATATTYILPPVVGAFRKQHPGVRFYVREHGSASVAAAVATGELDLGIVTLPIKSAEATGLTQVTLASDEFRLITPPKHRLSEKKTFTWKELADEGIVAFEAGSAVRELIDRAARSAGVDLKVVMELRSIETIKRMVAAGIGVGFVSRFALRDGEGLVCRDARLERQLAIVKPGGRAPTAAAAAFERMILSSLK